MSACGAVPQVRDLTQVLRQVILVVSLGGQLQVMAEPVQPHRIRPTKANTVLSNTTLTKWKNNNGKIYTELEVRLCYNNLFHLFY